MSDYVKRIVNRAETREGAGTYTLACGHQIAVAGDDWSKRRLFKQSHRCHECERNDQHQQEKVTQ
jgi:hypothetical protein